MNIETIAAWVLGLSLSTFSVSADETKDKSSADVKELSGISIVGNDEAPKSLFIVPWKSSEIGFESDLTAKSLLDGSLRPLDKEVFMRELNYFDIRSERGTSSDN